MKYNYWINNFLQDIKCNMKENMKKFLGLKVKALRESAHLTQEDLASICDVSWRTISNLERGLVVPDLTMVIKIAKHFNIGIDEMVNYKIESGKSIFRIEKEMLISEKIKTADDRILNYLSEELDLLLRHLRP